jgi:elongation factor G
MRDRLRANAVAIQLPIGSETNFQGIVDLVRMRAYIYNNDQGTDIEETDIPAEMQAMAEEYRAKLVEAVAETDEALIEKYLDGVELTEAEIRQGLRKGTTAVTIVPVLCGSAFKNKGVQLMLDAVVDYLPAPSEVPPIQGILPNGDTVERRADDAEPLAALAFKIMADPYGRLTFVRVYSGVLKKGSYVLNATKDKKERVSRLVVLKADERSDVDELRAGDLGAALGLKDTLTGDTICDENAPVILESLFIPEPVFQLQLNLKLSRTWISCLRHCNPCLKKIPPSASTLIPKLTKP